MTTYDPVIVVGMHRSGTTILSRLLNQAGQFSGWLKDSNNESYFFIALNEWVLNYAGGRWDNPAPIDWILEQPDAQSAIAEHLEKCLRSLCSLAFSGRHGLLRRALAGEFPVPWGWKDPRNAVTLPIWLRLFPNAKVLHITRHGVDVAASLRTRQRDFLERRGGYTPRWACGSTVFGAGRMVNSIRCMSLRGGLSLWAEYLDRAQNNLAAVPEHRKLTIKYEELVARPAEVLAQAAEFCGASDIALSKPLERLSIRGRANAWAQDDELSAFADEARNILSRYGY